MMRVDEKWRLVIEDLHGGHRWEIELADDDSLDLSFHVKSWIEKESDGCLRLVQDSLSPMPGSYLAMITDDPREISCWDCGYFETEAVPE